MIAGIITDKDGVPLQGSTKLLKSEYNPTGDVAKLLLQVQKDYINAWQLQRQPFDEFDGHSLLERTRLDQETFAAYVGMEFVPQHKRWRFRGRKNTARNKLIGILSHILAGMLFPSVNAKTVKDEEDKLSAKVIYILVEEHLRKANYDIKFLYLCLSALVNPATFAGVEYVRAMQKIKIGGAVQEVVDEFLTGLRLHVLPIDEVLLGDFYSGTGTIYLQPHIFRVRRISYDEASAIYKGKYFDGEKDLFDFVEPGKTHWFSAGEKPTGFSADNTAVDGNFVQEIKAYYRSEDLEVCIVGGVFLGETKDPYNSNPFTHRRMQYSNKEWVSVPVYPIAMSGFEPIDPAGRFAYYKSGAFKEYWDDKKINELDRVAVDGVKLEVMKPLFMSGIAKLDSTVIAPGATVSMPLNATVTPYSLGSNLANLYKAIQDGAQDMSESTQDKVMQGVTEPGVTATQTVVAKQQAKIFLGVFGLLVADLVRQIGELTIDCVIEHATVGELDSTVPEALRLKYKTFLAKGKDKGKNITNKIIFTDKYMGRKISQKEKRKREWELYEQAGGEGSDQRIFEANPYALARTMYTMFVDADKIISRSMGTDRQEKNMAFERFMDPRVQPFIDTEAVVNDFLLEEYSDGDPERYKRKEGQDEAMKAMLGMAGSSPPQGQKPTGNLQEMVMQ